MDQFGPVLDWKNFYKHSLNGDIVHTTGNKRGPPKIDGFKQFWHTGLRVNVCGSCGAFKKKKSLIWGTESFSLTSGWVWAWQRVSWSCCSWENKPEGLWRSSSSCRLTHEGSGAADEAEEATFRRQCPTFTTRGTEKSRGGSVRVELKLFTDVCSFKVLMARPLAAFLFVFKRRTF